MSYCSDRLKALKITEKANSYKTVDMDGHTIDFRFFRADDKDNITIGYIAPDGKVIEYETENRKTRAFERTRLKEPKGDMKYTQPAKTETYPFATPEILKAYKKKDKVQTLYIVEGEFKAFALSNFGLPAFGIGGIQNFRNAKKDDIHPLILDFCEVCQVENIELIHDADALKVEWKEGKDLATRLTAFYSAINIFNEFLKPHNINLYYAHVVKDSDQKGIDDLLYYGQSDTKLVIDELTKLTAGSKERKYILTYQITGISSFRIQQIFGIDSVQSFYEMNQSELENREFVYRGEYYFVNGEGKLQVSWKGEQRNYLRIGTDYYKKIAKMGPNGQTEFEIVKWSEKNIKDDFHSSKEFLKNIIKCDAFANVPENDPDKYRQIITSEKEGVKSVLYNRYSPIYHVPKEGDWRTINKLLHHIFDYKNLDGEPMYEFALDYIQLLYTQPTKHLPILCLVSTERGTGKTTFLEMLKATFVENMRILDSARLTSNFNGSWAGKLIVAVDESFINMDEKNGAANKLKMIATNETIPSEAKGKDSDEIPNFSKLILCSNDEYNFVRIDWEENRYAIIKVGSIPESELNPHMRDNLREEIPAFLYFLKNRQLYYKEKSRLYFEERVYMTPQLEMIQARTEGGLARNIKDVIRNQFYLQQTESIRLSLTVIEELVRLQYKFATKIQIRDYLNDKGYKTGAPTSFTYLMYAGDDMGITRIGRCYTFNMYDFLTAEEMADLQNEKK